MIASNRNYSFVATEPGHWKLAFLVMLCLHFLLESVILAMHPSSWMWLTNHCWFKVYKHCTGYMFPWTSFAEESVEGIIAGSGDRILGHLPIWLDPVFQAVELPTGVTDLHTGLAHVDADALPLKAIYRLMCVYAPSTCCMSCYISDVFVWWK